MSENLRTYDVAIIGGGPAGAAASILLHRAGCDVILLEKETCAKDKICGEFLSWEIAYYLKNLGIDLHALGGQPIEVLRLILGKDLIEQTLPHSAWSLSRRVLDEVILNKAYQHGVTIERGKNVTSLSKINNIWMLRTSSQDTLYAKTVFMANGKHDLRGWKRQKQPKQDLIGFKMHFKLSNVQAEKLYKYVEIELFKEGYAGLELVDEKTANLCFMITKSYYNSCGKSWTNLLSNLINQSTHLALRLENSTALWDKPLTIYNVPYGYIFKSDPKNLDMFRLGDQLAVIPSFTGDGVAMALHSAFIATNIYLSGGTAHNYHQKILRDFSGTVRNGQLIGHVISTQLSRKMAFWLLQTFPKLILTGINSTRVNPQ